MRMDMEYKQAGVVCFQESNLLGDSNQWHPISAICSDSVKYINVLPSLTVSILTPQRAMCAIYSLMCSDLLSHDQIFAITQQHLQELSQESPGAVANKATKVTCGQYSCSCFIQIFPRNFSIFFLGQDGKCAPAQ